MILVVALQALYGLAIPMNKLLLNYATPVFASALRMLLAGITLLGVERFYYKRPLNVFYRSYTVYLYAASVYLKYMMRAGYIGQLSCSRMAFLFNLGPFITAVFSYTLSAEQFTRRQWIAVSIGCLASMWPLLQQKSTCEGLALSWADLILVIAMVINTYGLTLKKRLLVEEQLSIPAVNGIAAFSGGALGLLTAYRIETSFITHIGPFIGWFTALLLLSNIVCRNLYAVALKRYSITFLAFCEFLMNGCMALYGALFFGETITTGYLISTCVVWGSLYIFYQDET